MLNSNVYLQVSHLSKTYVVSPHQQVIALDALSLDLSQGDFLVILGPSGSGKSTLLNLMAGLESPTTGSIDLLGSNFIRTPIDQRNLGMVFQNPTLYPHLSIYENLAYPLKNKKLSKHLIQEKISSISALFNIEEFLQRMPHEISGGQRQRICIAKALIKNPQLCLFDEPLSALDAQLRSQMVDEIKNLHQKLGFTAIYVTHDHQEAAILATKIAILDQGKCLQIGTCAELHNAPSTLFCAKFFGFSPMFFLDPSYQDQSLKIDTNEPSILAIRSEYILVQKPKEPALELTIEIQKTESLGFLTKIYTQFQEKNYTLSLSTNMICPYLDHPQLRLYLPISKTLVYEKESGLLLGYFSDFCYHKS